MPKDLHELPKLRDSLSYLFVEHARIEQEASAIALYDQEGQVNVPVAALGVLMLGPGTAITHAAMHTLVENGCSVVWIGEDGVRCYAQGLGETRSSRHTIRQARLMCNEETHIEVVWRMYEYRFGYRLDRTLSLSQIRGMEGARMRDVYATESERTGVPWEGRHWGVGAWERSDPINRALSAANACLNGICHAAIVSGGYSTALGFIHVGQQLSFVYDVADLYKAEITIPLAFDIVAESTEEVERRVRLKCREVFRERHLLSRILPDIDGIFDMPIPGEDIVEHEDEEGKFGIRLWSKLWEGSETT